MLKIKDLQGNNVFKNDLSRTSSFYELNQLTNMLICLSCDNWDKIDKEAKIMLEKNSIIGFITDLSYGNVYLNVYLYDNEDILYSYSDKEKKLILAELID